MSTSYFVPDPSSLDLQNPFPTDADVTAQDGSAPIVWSSPGSSPSSAAPPSSDSTASGDGFLSGIGQLLPSIMTSVSSLYKIANPPKPVSVSPGSYVYNPASGTYQPAVSYNSGIGSINPVFILIGLAIVAIVVFRSH